MAKEFNAMKIQKAITPLIIVLIIIAGLIFARSAFNSAILFLLIIIALVMAHEAGHFFSAKLFGIYVHEFGLGFPPRIATIKKGETEYTLNAIPLGGFVKLEGEENPDHPRSLAAKPKWQRFIVLFAGIAVNFLLPVLLFALAFTWPHEVPIGRAMVTNVIPEGPAAIAGIKVNDQIFSIDGRDAKNLPEASRLIRLKVGETVNVTVRRDGNLINIPVYARWSPPEGQGPTGISIGYSVVAPDGRPFTERESLPPWESIPMGIQQTWDTLILVRNEIASWGGQSGSPQFAGPVGIGQTVGEIVGIQETPSAAVSPLLEITALLSINLAIINLLPLPMLDGGRIFFLLLEVIRRGKRINPQKEAIVHMIGFFAFIILAIIITFFDIARITSGESLLR